MPSLQSLRLGDIPPLAALVGIAQDLRIELTLHGGTASRVAMQLFYRPDEELDLFDLAPFSSDIDLEHSGDDEKTVAIRSLIEERVPFASWFRWSIVDRKRAKRAAGRRAVSTRIPLRRIRFSSGRDAEVSLEAIEDLKQRQVSFTRNPGYRDAQPPGERLDVEFYGLMLALNVAAEMRDISGKPVYLSDQAASRSWFDEAAGEQLAAAATSPRLAARFWHLLAPQLARAEEDGFAASLLVDLAAKTGILDPFHVNLARIRHPGHAFTVSKFTASRNFRVPELTPEIVTGEEASLVFGRIIRERRTSLGLASEPDAVIDPAFELVAIVPYVTIRTYDAQSARDDRYDVFYSGAQEEFVEIAWHQPGGLPHYPRGLTAQLISRYNVVAGAAASALPAVGGMFHNSRAWVRVRVDDFLEPNQRGASLATLVVLQATDG